MSYARFGSTHIPGHAPSDVYVFASVGGFLECCGCPLALAGSFRMGNMTEANEHFAEHERVGHSCGEPWTDMLGDIQKDAGAIWRGEPFDFQLDVARDHVRALGTGAPAIVRIMLPGGDTAEFDAVILGPYGSATAGGLILDVDTDAKPRIIRFGETKE